MNLDLTSISFVDAIIVVLLILGAMSGLRRGLVKQAVLLVGLVAILIMSFYIRVPVSTYMYKHLPFFSFGGLFKGVSVLNIILYEVIAFLIVFSILYLVLRVLLKISGLIENILKATIILGFFSRIGGMIVGILESYIIVFILLFILSQPFIRVTGLELSVLTEPILTKTPIMSDAVKNTKTAVDEIMDLKDTYKNDGKNFNEKAIELFIKYEIVTEENIEYLREKGKLD